MASDSGYRFKFWEKLEIIEHEASMEEANENSPAEIVPRNETTPKRKEFEKESKKITKKNSGSAKKVGGKSTKGKNSSISKLSPGSEPKKSYTPEQLERIARVMKTMGRDILREQAEIEAQKSQAKAIRRIKPSEDDFDLPLAMHRRHNTMLRVQARQILHDKYGVIF